MRTDLHLHTTASDGRWTPERTVTGVEAEGIRLFAVADHDTIESVKPLLRLIQGKPLGFLPAVEISTMDQGRLLHVLGYGIDPDHPELLAFLKENHAQLAGTDDEDIQQLIDLGYPLSYEEYLTYDYDRTRGGFKSLNFLIDKGLVKDAHDFFHTIRAQLNHRWPDFVPPAHAAAVIRSASGQPVLAHPGASFAKYGGVTPENLDPLLEQGIAGLECYSQYHDAETTECCLAWCEQHGLLITGGSDYHGGFVGRQLGVPEVDSAQLRLGALEAAIVWGTNGI